MAWGELAELEALRAERDGALAENEALRSVLEAVRGMYDERCPIGSPLPLSLEYQPDEGHPDAQADAYSCPVGNAVKHPTGERPWRGL